jgi:hypothetical protein
MAEFEDDVREGEARIERMQAYRDQHKGKALKDLVLAMQKAQFRKVAIEADLKNANAEFDVLRFELVPEKMDEDGVERVSYDGVGRVSLTPDLRVNTPAGAKPNLFAWFKSKKLGDLIVPSVNASTLKAWVKQRIKEGKELPPSEMLNVTPITRASITKE